MLYSYPIEATKGNWLQACLCRILRTIHASIRNSVPVPGWPDLIPTTYRSDLQRRTGLRNRLEQYATELANLTPLDRRVVYIAICGQNRIRRLLSNQCNCARLDELPAGIRTAASNLSREAFRLLSKLGIRDEQYQTIYNTIRHKVCPFCGLEYFDAPEAPREDLDHYLPQSRYPFAGANLKNLVPMGGRCNSAYKGKTDMLWNGTTRRRAFFPYGHPGVSVSLKNSSPFGGTNVQHPCWEVSFSQDSEEIQTWDDVFHIRERYKRDVLDPEYESWLRGFKTFCEPLGLQPTDTTGLLDAMQHFHKVCEEDGLSGKGFLKSAVFEMLIYHCQQDNQRLIHLLMKVATAAA